MVLAAINWLSISINLLLVVFVIVCLLMSLLILMQRPKQEGLGAAFGGGVTDQVFGARTTNVLQRGTVYLGSLFFIISMTLAILIGKQTKIKSLLESEKVVAEKSADKQETPAAGEIPKSLVDELSSAKPPATLPVEDPALVQETPAPPTEEAAPPTEEAAPPTEEAAPPTEEAAPVTPSENAADKPE